MARPNGTNNAVSSSAYFGGAHSGSPPTRRWPGHGTVWRWHFYAGVLCIPFVLWLAATGSIYLFKPQIDAWLDRPYDSLTVAGPRAAPSQIVAAALASQPGTTLNAYELPQTEHSAVRVLLIRGSQLTRVYVHPQTRQILGAVDEDSRFTNQLKSLHGELMQGDRGSMIVETAASWTIVMLITGIYLWWPSDTAGAAGVLWPRFSRSGRLWWRDVHAVTGFWVSFFALFLLISGLPWAKSWGGLLKEVRHLGTAAAVTQDWTTGRSSELAQRALASAPDEHAAHHHGGQPSGTPSDSQALAVDYSALDNLIPVVAAEHLPPPVLIAYQSNHWTAKSDTQNRPQRVDLTLEANRIISRSEFSQRPLLDRVIGVGIAAHEGQLFAPLNQLLGLFTAVSLWLVCISAIVMWWRRRFTAPPRVAHPPFTAGLFLIIAVLAVLLPLFGATLLLVWSVDQSFKWKSATTVR